MSMPLLLSRGKHCPAFSRFNPDVPEYSVYDISRMQGKKLAELVDDDIFNTTHIPDDFPLTANQAVQVAVDKSGQPSIAIEKVRSELSGLEYPLYFLDYESVNPAIPMIDGTHPHQQVVFQYSLHIQDSSDSNLRHAEHLCRESSAGPLLALVKQMREDIGDTGSIIVWNKVFERDRNKELGQLFTEYESFYSDLNDRMYDLKDIFSKIITLIPDSGVATRFSRMFFRYSPLSFHTKSLLLVRVILHRCDGMRL